jgi:hypothetical protein
VLTTWRVRRGIKFMDTNIGRDVWLDRIDVDSLDVRWGTACPLAQATGEHFEYATYHLGFTSDYDRLDNFRLALLGFLDLPGEPWHRITAAWKREITALQRERATAREYELVGVG